MSAMEMELLQAAASGDIAAVQRIMSSEKSVNISYQNEEGISALHLAAMSGHYAVAEMLLKINFNKELKDCDAGETALHKSALHGHTNILELLLQKGADKEARSKNKSTPLHLAAQGGYIASVECLISHQADVDSVDVQGFTPLMHAAMYNHTSVVQALLENSCDVNDTNEEGATALHLSSEKGHKETTQLLVSWGADVERGDKNDMTPLMYAARAGHPDIVELLIEYGALIDHSSQSGWTALMYAVKENQLASAEMLCNKGASVNHCDQSGPLALQLAVESGFREVTQLLINRDAQTAVLTPEGGQSLLMLAATNGLTEIVALLVEEGADVNQINAVDGNTALHYASLFGQSETVKFLIEHCHADTSIVNEEHHSARALAFTAETKNAFPPDTSFFGKVKVAWEGLFGKPASSPAEITTIADSFNLKTTRWRHQRLLQEGQQLLARYEWIKKRDSLHADVESALKSGDYKQMRSCRLLLDEHEKTSSHIGIRESRYYTYPVRLLQSYYDLEGSSTNASKMSSAEVYHALDTKLQVLSQQRAGKDGIPLKNALTDKNYTIEELFREIEVLQQTLGVPRIDPTAPVELLPYGEKLVFKKELQSLLTQLVDLQGASTSSARGVADRSATGSYSGGDIGHQSVVAPARIYSVEELTQEINELKVLIKSSFEKRATGVSHTRDQLIQRVHNLQQALSGVDEANSEPSTLSQSGDKSTNIGEIDVELHFNNSLHKLLTNARKECPSLVWFYPKNSMFWLSDPVKYLLSDTLMMVFVCPVTFKVMKCGPQGTGWEVRAPREFLKKVMPVLWISLFAMQAAVLDGNEVLIPLSWQNSPISVADEVIPTIVVEAALNEKFNAGHFMRCMSAFADAIRSIKDSSNISANLLSSKFALQQYHYKQRLHGSAAPPISLEINFIPIPVCFEESYEHIHTFLTTGDNEKFGSLEDQLRGSMERVMADDGSIERVSLGASREWLRRHSQHVNTPIHLYSFQVQCGPGDPDSFNLTNFPPEPPATSSDIQHKLRVIYEEYAAQKQLSAAERLAQDGYVRPASGGEFGAPHRDQPLVSAPWGGGPNGDEDDGNSPNDRPRERRGSFEPCCPRGDRMTLIAAGKGHLACLDYAIYNHYFIHLDACNAAAAGNHVDCLDLLRENDAVWSADTTHAAAVNGSFEALHYLLEEDCPRSDDLLICAAAGGSRNCVRYLVEDRGLEMSDVVFGAAFERAHLECVTYLVDVGCPVSSYIFREENEWYLCRSYHRGPDVDKRFLNCILWAADRGWTSGMGRSNLAGYILDNPNMFPLCREHVVQEGWHL